MKDACDLFIFGSAATPALFNTMKKSNVNFNVFVNVSLISRQEFLLQSIYLPDLFALLSLAV